MEDLLPVPAERDVSAEPELPEAREDVWFPEFAELFPAEVAVIDDPVL